MIKGEEMEVGLEAGKRGLREECVVVGESRAGKEAGNQREGGKKEGREMEGWEGEKEDRRRGEELVRRRGMEGEGGRERS